MSENKFRVWDKFSEVMVYPREILSGGCIIVFLCGTSDAWERYEIMQYTGLKDRNGRKIYDGDIIEFTYGLSNLSYREYVQYIEDEGWVA